VVDVEIQHVGRDAARAELPRDSQHPFLAHVRPARLLVAQRPQRRQGAASRQRRVVAQDAGRAACRAAREDVVIQLAAVGAEAVAVRIRLAHVEPAAPRVVEEQAVAPAFMQGDEERDRRIRRILARRVVGHVRVPHHHRLLVPRQRERLLAEAVIELVIVAAHRRVDGAVVRVERHRTCRIARDDRVAGGVEYRDRHFRRHADHHARASLRPQRRRRIPFRQNGLRRGRHAVDGIRDVRREAACRRHPHAHDVGRDEADVHPRPAGHQQVGAVGGRHGLHDGADGPWRGGGGHRGQRQHEDG